MQSRKQWDIPWYLCVYVSRCLINDKMIVLFSNLGQVLNVRIRTQCFRNISMYANSHDFSIGRIFLYAILSTHCSLYKMNVFFFVLFNRSSFIRCRNWIFRSHLSSVAIGCSHLPLCWMLPSKAPFFLFNILWQPSGYIMLKLMWHSQAEYTENYIEMCLETNREKEKN